MILKPEPIIMNYLKGKQIDPSGLPDTVVCYLDCTVAVPILTAYALANRPRREPRRLIDRLPELVKNLKTAAGC